ncbi:MAG: hypothetical protein IJN91_02525 [Alphaproteobacteria bacterium]|nr:hypothetical protein [Alphaproteobacteria bacterium]
MKKTCLMTLTAIIGLTQAADAGFIAQQCQKKVDAGTHILLNANTNDERCVPVNACNDLDFAPYYCNRLFKNIQVSSVRDAEELVNMFIKNNMNISEGCAFKETNARVVGQDFVRCVLPNDGYIEFEFDDLSESNSETSEYSYLVGQCIAYGGNIDERATQDKPLLAQIPVNNARKVLRCRDVTKAQCEEMYNGYAGYVEADKTCVYNR